MALLIHGPDAGGKERNLFHWGEGAESFESADHTLANLVHGPVDCDDGLSLVMHISREFVMGLSITTDLSNASHVIAEILR